MKLLRSIHKWYALFNGYCWLPCPLCGEYIGGHEFSRKSGIIMDTKTKGRITCAKCKYTADRLNKDSKVRREAKRKGVVIPNFHKATDALDRQENQNDTIQLVLERYKGIRLSISSINSIREDLMEEIWNGPHSKDFGEIK